MTLARCRSAWLCWPTSAPAWPPPCWTPGTPRVPGSRRWRGLWRGRVRNNCDTVVGYHCVADRGEQLEQENTENTESVVLSIPRIEVTSYNEDGLPSYISFAEVRTLIIFIVLRESQDLNIDERLILIVIKVTRLNARLTIPTSTTVPRLPRGRRHPAGSSLLRSTSSRSTPWPGPTRRGPSPSRSRSSGDQPEHGTHNTTA